jgi:hypothetical protein
MQSAIHSEAVDRSPARDAQRWARAVVAVALLLAHRDARAERLRVLLLVGDEQQRELAARIEGQTADLDADVASAEAGPAGLDREVATLRAARAGADVVVWFVAAEGGGWIAHVARGGRVVVRRIDVAPGALSRSASIEAVALAVRTAVTGFASSSDDDAARELAEPAPAPARPWGELGATGLLDGTRAGGRYGAAVRAGIARGRFGLGAMLGYEPAAAIDGAPATFHVERQHVGAVVSAELAASPAPAPRWSLAGELGAGAARFRRSTTATGAGLVPTPAAVTWSPLLAPGVRLARRVASGAWLALQAGADVVLRRPEFGVQQPTGFQRLASVWALQPRATLSLLLDWR